MNDLYVPESLDISISGFRGPGYGLVKVDETLEYQGAGWSSDALQESIAENQPDRL